MKLNIEQIRAISCGAVRVEETDFGVSFFRFTKEQEEMYKERSSWKKFVGWFAHLFTPFL